MVTHKTNRQFSARKHRHTPSNFRHYERHRARIYWTKNIDIIAEMYKAHARYDLAWGQINALLAKEQPKPLTYEWDLARDLIQKYPTEKDQYFMNELRGISKEQGPAGINTEEKEGPFYAFDHLGLFRTVSFP